jgi:hypothetical protein
LVKQRCFLKKCVPFEIQMVKSERFPECKLFGLFSLPLARHGVTAPFSLPCAVRLFFIFFKKTQFYEKYPAAAARPAALPARPIPNRHQ